MPFAKGAPKPPGSGRKKGSKNKLGRDVRELAQMHTPVAISVLFDVMSDNQAPPAARVMAANAVLNRGHGKATQAITAPEAPVQVNLDIVRQQIAAKLERIVAAHESAKAAGRDPPPLPLAARLIEHVPGDAAPMPAPSEPGEPGGT